MPHIASPPALLPPPGPSTYSPVPGGKMRGAPSFVQTSWLEMKRRLC
jgi:hypothetical protein